MAGMEGEKQLIEQRIVLPSRARSRRAVRSFTAEGGRPVRPAGHRKTSFAKAVAGRLGWPFIEVFHSRLAAPDVAMSSALREAFATVMELEAAMIFIDEVEEIAGCRGESLRFRTRSDERIAQADTDVPPARRAIADLRDELGAVARPGVSAARQIRLHHPGRST